MRYHLASCLLLLWASTAQTEESPPTLYARPGGQILLPVGGLGSAFEAALDGGYLQPVTAPMLAPESGDHWLALSERDAKGSLSPIRWFRLRIDGDPPRSELILDPPAARGDQGLLWVREGTRVSVRAHDSEVATGKLRLQSPSGGRQTDSPRAVLKGAGPFELQAWAEDGAGNRSDASELRLHVDNAPPNIRVSFLDEITSGSVNPVVAPWTRLAILIDDEQSGIEHWVISSAEGEWRSSEATGASERKPSLGPVSMVLNKKGEALGAQWATWLPGHHELEITAVDRTGHSAGATISFDVEGTPPNIQWTILSDWAVAPTGHLVCRSPMVFRVKASDNSGVRNLLWSTDSKEWKSASGPIRVRAPLLVRAEDTVGNTTEMTLPCRPDEEAPKIVIQTPEFEHHGPAIPIELTVGQTLIIKTDPPKPFLSKYQYSLDAAPLADAPPKLTFRKPGNHILRVIAQDLAGNRVDYQWPVLVVSPPEE